MTSQAVTDTRTSEILRPNAKLWSGAVVVAVVTGAPIFAALYWLTIPRGTAGNILAVQVVLTLLLTAGIDRVRVAGVIADHDGLRERGYFGRWRFTPHENISSIVVIKVLDQNSQETIQQLFVLDRNGRTLLRLRGQLWGSRTMNQLVHALEIPVKFVENPLTAQQARREYGSNLYWHERHPRLTSIVTVTAGVLVATPIYLSVNTIIAS